MAKKFSKFGRFWFFVICLTVTLMAFNVMAGTGAPGAGVVALVGGLAFLAVSLLLHRKHFRSTARVALYFGTASILLLFLPLSLNFILGVMVSGWWSAFLMYLRENKEHDFLAKRADTPQSAAPQKPTDPTTFAPPRSNDEPVSGSPASPPPVIP